jgi:L-asparaginase/Glu-tRNA(Gln) amidotransferase subunit D
LLKRCVRAGGGGDLSSVRFVSRSYPGIQHGHPMALVPFGGSICSLDAAYGAKNTALPAMVPYLLEIVHASFAGLKRSYGILPAGESYLVRSFPDKSTIHLRDSSHLTHQDYSALLEVVRQHQARVIIVPMGTTKLIESARYIQANLSDGEKGDKLVVFTGSHRLWYNVPGDAQFNLGYALAQRFSERTGVVVAMHGGVFDPDKIFLSGAESGGVATLTFLSRAQEFATPTRNFSQSVLSMGGTIEGAEVDLDQRFAYGFFKDYLQRVINPRQMPDYINIASDRDSRELSEKDIGSLIANIDASRAQELVVPVGTFGAERVAASMVGDESLMQNIRAQGKRVLLTVACILPSEGAQSDAPANMGFAMGVAPHIKEPGVYLAVNGTVCDPSAVKKVSLPDKPPFYVPAQFVNPQGELINPPP